MDDRERDLIEDLVFGEGPEYMIEQSWICSDDVTDSDLKETIMHAHLAYQNWKDAAKLLQQVAERVLKDA